MICLHIIFIRIYYLNTKESFLSPFPSPSPCASLGKISWLIIRHVQLPPWLPLFLILDPPSMAKISLFSFSTLIIFTCYLL